MRPVLLVVLLPCLALAQTQGAVRVWLGSGFDSNARRDYVRDDRSNGVRPEPDLVFSAIGSAEGVYRGSSLQLGGSYDLGIREFLRLPTENVVIQSGSAEVTYALGRYLGVGLSGRGKDRRGGERDYSDLYAQATVLLVPDAQVELEVHGGAHRFLYWEQIASSFASPEVGASARYRFDKRHRLTAFGEAGSRRYQAQANPPPGNPEAAPAVREDRVLSGGASYQFKGPFAIGLGYSFTEGASNSFGETFLRHRLTLTGGARLPWKLTFLGQVAVQLSKYPDGVYLSDELNIAEDEDTHNSVSAKLVRPLAPQLDVEVRYAAYQDRLPQNGFAYLRQLGWLGLTWRL